MLGINCHCLLETKNHTKELLTLSILYILYTSKVPYNSMLLHPPLHFPKHSTIPDLNINAHHSIISNK